jgi:hypothetical protein
MARNVGLDQWTISALHSKHLRADSDNRQKQHGSRKTYVGIRTCAVPKERKIGPYDLHDDS